MISLFVDGASPERVAPPRPHRFLRHPGRALLAATLWGWGGIATAVRAQENAPPPKLAEIVREIAPAPGARKVTESDLQAYLLIYFRNETHSLYFAVSKDGRAFKEINDNQPLLRGKDLAEQ